MTPHSTLTPSALAGLEASEIVEIRKRHERAERDIALVGPRFRTDEDWRRWLDAHADRATLLARLAELRAIAEAARAVVKETRESFKACATIHTGEMAYAIDELRARLDEHRALAAQQGERG